jgi:hypothetical protein
MSEYIHNQPAAKQLNFSKLLTPIMITIIVIVMFIAGNTYPDDEAKTAEPTPAQLAEIAIQEKAEAEKKAAIADKRAQAYSILEEANKLENPEAEKK